MWTTYINHFLHFFGCGFSCLKRLWNVLLLPPSAYNDIIAGLIDAYENIYFGKFSDDEANYYNERIRHFENEDYACTRKNWFKYSQGDGIKVFFNFMYEN